MNTLGRHLHVEYRGCSADRLDDQDYVEVIMRRAAEAAGTTIVQSAFHRFSPQVYRGQMEESRSMSVKCHDRSSGRGFALSGVSS